MTFSEIVNTIQNDTDKAAELLVVFANEQQIALADIKLKEEQLQKSNDYYSATMKNIEMVCKHVKKYPHFSITKNNKFYHFTPEFQVVISDIDWKL